MSLKTFCDICDKEIKDNQRKVRLNLDYELLFYCLICWSDMENWPKIHLLSKSS